MNIKKPLPFQDYPADWEDGLCNVGGILGSQEMDGARKVLRAAAMTYVASAAAAILQLLRLVLLFGGRDRD